MNPKEIGSSIDRGGSRTLSDREVTGSTSTKKQTKKNDMKKKKGAQKLERGVAFRGSEVFCR